MRGLCIDPTYPEGTPTQRVAIMYRALRYVLFQNPDSWPYTSDSINGGWYVRGLYASNSGDLQHFANWGPPNFDITIGNEPDIQSPSSWTMSPEEYEDQLWLPSSNFQAPRWIAGMASGDPRKAEQYVKRCSGAEGLTIHLYTLGPGEVRQRISDYASLGLPLRVGEWGPFSGFRLFDYEFPEDMDVNDFCYSKAMHPDFGIYA